MRKTHLLSLYIAQQHRPFMDCLARRSLFVGLDQTSSCQQAREPNFPFIPHKQTTSVATKGILL